MPVTCLIRRAALPMPTQTVQSDDTRKSQFFSKYQGMKLRIFSEFSLQKCPFMRICHKVRIICIFDQEKTVTISKAWKVYNRYYLCPCTRPVHVGESLALAQLQLLQNRDSHVKIQNSVSGRLPLASFEEGINIKSTAT